MTSGSSAQGEIDVAGVRELIRLAFAEDAPFGDVSAYYSVPEMHQSNAKVIAREDLIFCGVQFVPLLFSEFGRGLSFDVQTKDGDRAKDGDTLLLLNGPTRAVLQIERPLLNFLQRLCGVASHTAETLSQAHGITVLDTRKTMPGWRALDKYAVRAGGGKNHRFSLSDMIMIKNNHIDAHGGDIAATLAQVNARKPRYMPVQIEVRTLQELKAALPFAPTAVMLDNMNDADIKSCLEFLAREAPKVLVEVSGGITAHRFAALSKLGVPAVSIGSLTTAARNRDISLRILKAGS